MKWIRLFVPVALALAAAGLLLLTRSGSQVEALDDWPLVHKNLSVSASDSTNADVEVIQLANGAKVAVAVWMEGLSDIQIMGSIKMRWKFQGASGTWRINSSQVFPAPSTRYVYGYPALALYQSSNNLYAHIAWLRTDRVANKTGVSYQRCLLTASSAVCDNPADLSYENSAAPAIAVDASGVPHVVWQQKAADNFDAIYYNNRAGGVWGTPWAIRTQQGPGLTFLRALGKSPTIAVRGTPGAAGSVVAVGWDREIDSGGTGETYAFLEWVGIWFARRTSLGALGTGNTEAARWDMHPISTPNGVITPKTIQDDQPKLSAGQNGIYLAWHRLSFMGPTAFSPFCREYDVAYRVFLPPFTQTVDSGWWPGPAANDFTWRVPYSATTYVPSDVAGTAQDLYSGARPSIQAVPVGGNDQLHIAWQRSAHASCGGGGGPQSLDDSNDVRASGEGDVDSFPLQVWHAVATHTLSGDTMSASSWVSQQITVQQTAIHGFFSSPNLSVIAGDGSPLHPHVTVLDRFKTSATAYAWDVWYVNDEEFSDADADGDPTVYLPIVFKNYY